jgi:two-component system, response regulator
VNPKDILLIEDNPSDVDLTIRAFQKSRIANKVVVVSDGRQALDYLFGSGSGQPLASSDLPALALLDLKLPGISGLDLLRRIRQDPRTHQMPVVILTSSAEEDDIAAGYNLGANSFVRKPVDFQQFAEAVQHVGLYWLVLNQPPPEVH